MAFLRAIQKLSLPFQRFDGVYAGGAPGGQITRRQRNDEQTCADCGKGAGVTGSDLK